MLIYPQPLLGTLKLIREPTDPKFTGLRRQSGLTGLLSYTAKTLIEDNLCVTAKSSRVRYLPWSERQMICLCDETPVLLVRMLDHHFIYYADPKARVELNFNQGIVVILESVRPSTFRSHKHVL